MLLLTIVAVAASAVAKSKSAARSVAIPTLRVVSNLLDMVKLGIASDVRAVHDDLLLGSHAEATKKDAEARERLAAAVEAENRSRFSEQRARLELELQKAEVAKALGEARKTTAEARVTEAKAAALERITTAPLPEVADQDPKRLKAALRRLNSKGGHLFADVEELKALEAELSGDPSPPAEDGL